MHFSVLSSGSKANCTFIEAASTRILIDCGLSARQTEKRLHELGIAADSLDAIIITHEHSDHIYGVPAMSRKHKLPVFANKGTAAHITGPYGLELFTTGESFWIGGLKISPFSIVHDATDPVGFTIQAEGIKYGQATDLGRITPLVRDALTQCQALLLESNHDQTMLRECSYPWVLKQRISSSHGHLSNDTAGAFLSDLMHSDLTHVVLGHLSENSNTPECALETVNSYLRERAPVTLRCASVVAATPLVDVEDSSLRIAV